MKSRMESRTLGESKSTFSNIDMIRHTKEHGEYSRKAQKDSSSGGGTVALSLLVGAGAGILAGLFMAPQKGKEMRKKVTDTATKLGDQVNKSLAATKDKVSSLTNKSGGEQSNESMKGATTPPAPATTAPVGSVNKSPYTDPNKHSDSEVKSMINDPKTPGATSGPSIPPRV